MRSPWRLKAASDPRFNSKVLARFINKIMLRGKKSLAEQITYRALEIVNQKTGREAMEVFSQALGNAMPLVAICTPTIRTTRHWTRTSLGAAA